MRENKKILDIALQHYMNCYSHNAYFVNCILTYKNMYPWFYEKYIQLYYTEKIMRNTDKHEIFLDFYGGWTEPRKLLKCRHYDRDVIENEDIISFIENQIIDGYYVYTYLDEYYTILMKKEHLCHDVSIYGFDHKNKLLYVIGFDQYNSYTKYTITYDTFITALNAGISLSHKYEPEGGINYFLGVMPDFDKEKVYEINMDNLRSDLYDYINCINTSEKIKTSDPNFQLYTKPGNKYGMLVYNSLTDLLRGCSDKDEIDYRVFHTLYEHKKIMKMRCHYLKDDLKYPISELDLTQIDNIAEELKIIRFMVLKHNIKPEYLIREHLIQSIDKLKKIEAETLTNIYKCIKE